MSIIEVVEHTVFGIAFKVEIEENAKGKSEVSIAAVAINTFTSVIVSRFEDIYLKEKANDGALQNFLDWIDSLREFADGD